jgi:hypothetical protein
VGCWVAACDAAADYANMKAGQEAGVTSTTEPLCGMRYRSRAVSWLARLAAALLSGPLWHCPVEVSLLIHLPQSLQGIQHGALL